jgi:hypothetical protein
MGSYLRLGLRSPGISILLLVLAVLQAGCSGAGNTFAPVSPPAESEARKFVDQIVQLALNRDFDGLCALGSPECRFILSGQTDNVPTSRPMVANVVIVLSERTSSDTWTPGGVLFSLCGFDGKGTPYRSQMLVSENPWGPGLMAMEPVFWTGLSIGGSIAAATAPISSSGQGGIWSGCPV